MEEDYQDTIVLNKDEAKALEAEVAEAQAKAEEEAAAEVKEDSIPDDIEYTLLVHEVPDLTIALPKPEPAQEVLERAEAPGKETQEEPEEPAEAADAEETEDAEKTEGAEEAETSEEEQAEEEKQETGYGLPAGHAEIGELNERIAARRRYNERKKRRLRTRFYVFMTILILAAFFIPFSLSSIFTVDSIEVRGNSHYTAEEIINMGHAVPGRNLIYNLKGKEIEDYLEQNPYIKSSKVSRKLPSTMVIKVTERAERMAFRYDDDYLIMDEDGILLKKTRNAPKTTLIEGIIVNKIKLGEQIGAEDSGRLDRSIDLIHGMIAGDLYFVKVDMSNEKKVKAYIYDTLAVKTDYDTLMTNMENGRLHLVLEKIFEDGIERGTITFDADGTASFQPTI